MGSYHQVVASVLEGVDGFFRTAFDEIEVSGPPLQAAELQKDPLMIACTHRSHVDYFLLGYKIFQMGFKNMRFAAGDNLTRLPYIGPRFKAFGAFPVSRDTGFERNYVRNLCTQVAQMLENREAVMVFPEGGRSYSGAMLDIRSGVLGALVMVQARSPDRDVRYLPAAVSYEKPPDVRLFNILLKGKKLRKQSNPFHKRLLGNALYFGADIAAFAPFYLAPRFGRRYGKAYVDYLDPVSVRSLVDIDANRAPKARDEFSAHRVSMQKVSEMVHQQFLCLYRLLPSHVISHLLKKRRGLSCAEAIRQVPEVLYALRKENRNLKTLDRMSPEQVVEQGIEQLSWLKGISVSGDHITVRKRRIIDYCAAAIG